MTALDDLRKLGEFPAVEEYEKVKARYDADPQRRNYDFFVAGAAIAALVEEVALLMWMLKLVWVQHFGLDTFDDWLADLAARWEKENR